MTFEASGLKKLVRSNIVVAVSETVRVDATLPVGLAKETVTVTGEPPPLQTDSAVVGVVATYLRFSTLPRPVGKTDSYPHLP